MKILFVVTALTALGLAGCQTGVSYADAQASCEAQGYRIGTKRFDRCVNDIYRTYNNSTAVTVGVVEDPVYVAPAPVVVGGYYGGSYYGRRYYGAPYYGGPAYGGYYWR